MKILNADQTRQADQYTISHEPVSSVDLMERAARAFTNWFVVKFRKTEKVRVVCGKGNNGGDGLAIARMLHQAGFNPEVYIVNHSDKSSADFTVNLARLEPQICPRYVDSVEDFNPAKNDTVLIDALFGSGLSKPLSGLAKDIVEAINSGDYRTVSVDIPSGLFMDQPNDPSNTVVKADYTISFELPKLAFLLPQNATYTGRWEIVKIGLDQRFIENSFTPYFYTDHIGHLIKRRDKFSHKGTFGTALLIAGSKGMMGAATLSAKACMRSGAGKLQVHVPATGNDILQIAAPEAMSWTSAGENHIDTVWSPGLLEKFDATGVGPGIGTHEETALSLASLFASKPKKMVIDADALNLLNSEKGKAIGLLSLVPEGSILTPHPKEFERLTDKKWKDDYEKLELLSGFAVSHKVIICLKGHHTAVALPDGTIHFNSTGNPGMATAGSGDVLTGMILAFLAQGYSPEHAAICGVFEHGAAGDRAAAARSERSLIAGDIIENIR